jgi:hypothetical protein
MILKTAMGIETNNLTASGDVLFFVLVYAPTVIKPGYKPPKGTVVPRRPALLLLMPDPVNAWT